MIRLPLGESAPPITPACLNRHAVRMTVAAAISEAKRAHAQAQAACLAQDTQDTLFLALVRLEAAHRQLLK